MISEHKAYLTCNYKLDLDSMILSLIFQTPFKLPADQYLGFSRGLWVQVKGPKFLSVLTVQSLWNITPCPREILTDVMPTAEQVTCWSQQNYVSLGNCINWKGREEGKKEKGK